jgi:hypothetical protein
MAEAIWPSRLSSICARSSRGVGDDGVVLCVADLAASRIDRAFWRRPRQFSLLRISSIIEKAVKSGRLPAVCAIRRCSAPSQSSIVSGSRSPRPCGGQGCASGRYRQAGRGVAHIAASVGFDAQPGLHHLGVVCLADDFGGKNLRRIGGTARKGALALPCARSAPRLRAPLVPDEPPDARRPSLPTVHARNRPPRPNSPLSIKDCKRALTALTLSSFDIEREAAIIPVNQSSKGSLSGFGGMILSRGDLLEHPGVRLLSIRSRPNRGELPFFGPH